MQPARDASGHDEDGRRRHWTGVDVSPGEDLRKRIRTRFSPSMLLSKQDAFKCSQIGLDFSLGAPRRLSNTGRGGGDTLLPPSLSCRNRAAAPIFHAAFLPRAQFDLNLATMLDAAFIAAIGIAQRIKATIIERGTRFSAD